MFTHMTLVALPATTYAKTWVLLSETEKYSA